MKSPQRLKVAIIGGGIAGAEVVRTALPGSYDIALIEPKSQIECQALYPEYLAGNAPSGRSHSTSKAFLR